MKKVFALLVIAGCFTFATPISAMNASSDLLETIAKPIDKKPGKKKKKEAAKSCHETQPAKPSCCSGSSHCSKPKN